MTAVSSKSRARSAGAKQRNSIPMLDHADSGRPALVEGEEELKIGAAEKMPHIANGSGHAVFGNLESLEVGDEEAFALGRIRWADLERAGCRWSQ